MPWSRTSKSPPFAADFARSSARARSRLDRREPLVDALEALADLLAELVERRAEPGRIEELGDLAPVAVEVLAEQAADPADGRVTARLVEQLVHELLEGATIAEELLERPRQPAVAVREVGAQDVLHGAGRGLVDGRRLGHELLELAADHVDVHGRGRVLHGQQADAQRALHDGRSLGGLAIGERGGEGGVHDHEALDDDPVAVDAHRDRGADGRRAWGPASAGGGFGLP